jgi:hypothetical protein
LYQPTTCVLKQFGEFVFSKVAVPANAAIIFADHLQLTQISVAKILGFPQKNCKRLCLQVLITLLCSAQHLWWVFFSGRDLIFVDERRRS